MTKARIAFGVCFVIWALMLLIGVDLYRGLASQGVPGYPKPGQLRLYVLFPCYMVALNVIILTFLGRARWLVVILILLAQFFAFLISFFLMGGGV